MRFPRRELKPEACYYLLAAGYTLFLTVVISVNLVFQVQAAGLGPLQLVLVGTVLEATIFVLEVPTGVVADTISRRRSVLIGLVLVGIGLAFSGAFARFETILIAQVIWGAGHTFISGARQAWIADEVGAAEAGRIYLRSAQIEQVARIVAIPIGVGLGAISLHLPLIVGGLLFLPLALLMALTMSETGFRPAASTKRPSLGSYTATFLEGGRLVRRTPLLITIFCIAAIYGAFSEGIDRLWVKHFYDNLRFPAVGDLQPVIWIGVVRMGSALIGIPIVEFVKRRVDTTSHAVVVRGLFLITAVQITTCWAFALSGNFLAGMLAFWVAVDVSRAYDPLFLAWINQNTSSNVRATVISMSSQMDAIGQIAGGPPLGAVGSFVSVRAALIGAGLVLAPALPFYVRAFGQSPAQPPDSPETPSSVGTQSGAGS